MNPDARDSPLLAAMAAARRLLLHVIDVRFNLDEAAEGMQDGHPLVPDDLRRLRAAAADVQHEIECLIKALPPFSEPAGMEDEESMTAFRS